MLEELRKSRLRSGAHFGGQQTEALTNDVTPFILFPVFHVSRKICFYLQYCAEIVAKIRLLYVPLTGWILRYEYVIPIVIFFYLRIIVFSSFPGFLW